MTAAIVFFQGCILLDACCVINLYASGQMEAILKSIYRPVAVTAYVCFEEALKVYSGSRGDGVQTYEQIDLQPAVNSGLLTLVSPETEGENISFVNFAAALGDDGEAITGAIALHRNWSIGTDDRRAISFFAQHTPQLQVITTPELIKHWVDTTNPSFDIISIALQKVSTKARYLPHLRHPLYSWWQAYNHISQ